MVSTGKACFEIAQHGIDPPELEQIPGFAATGEDHRMRTSSIGYPVETMEAIGQDLTFRIQSTARPAFYGGTGKPLDRGESRVDGMTLRIQGLMKVSGQVPTPSPTISSPSIAFETARAFGDVWALTELWKKLGFGLCAGYSARPAIRPMWKR